MKLEVEGEVKQKNHVQLEREDDDFLFLVEEKGCGGKEENGFSDPSMFF